MKNKLKILVVDDDQMLCNWFNRKLKNHDVLFASGCKEAIDYLQSNKFDKVFLDYDLLDGEKSTSIAQYISDNDLNLETIIHTGDSIAAEQLKNIIKNNVKICDKAKLIFDLKEYIFL